MTGKKMRFPLENASAPDKREGCKREGTSTVSLNHPLVAKF